MEIFKLFGSIMVDSKDAQNSISKTGNQAEGMASKLAGGIKTAAKWAAGVTAAAVAVGTAMVNAAKDAAASMDTIDKGAKRMGISAEEYQKLAHAAELSGVSMTTMEQAAKKLEGTGYTFDEVMNNLMALENEEDRVAAAAEIFGETVAYKMGPLLQESGESFQDMKQEAEDLGLVLSDEAVAAGAAMNDQFTKITGSINGIKNAIIADIMPYVSEILDWVIENMPLIQQTVKKAMDMVLPAIKPVLNLVMATLPKLLELFISVVDALMPYLQPIIDGISSLFEGLFALVEGDTEKFKESFINAFKSIGSGMFELGKFIFTELWNGLKSIWGNISSWLSEKFSGITDFFGGIGSTVSGWFSHAGGTVVPYDNYPALLHRGETVLNASDSNSLVTAIRDLTAGGLADSSPINITVQSVLDGRVIGESVTTYQRQKARAYG